MITHRKKRRWFRPWRPIYKQHNQSESKNCINCITHKLFINMLNEKTDITKLINGIRLINASN